VWVWCVIFTVQPGRVCVVTSLVRDTPVAQHKLPQVTGDQHLSVCRTIAGDGLSVFGM
jgi:hypothetical protein